MPKGKGLSIAVLLGKGKPKGDGMDSEEMDSEDTESEELDPGLIEAMAEFRSAMAEEDDDGMAKAFKSAMECC